MKPTHWWNPKYPTMPNQLTAPNEGGGWEASYSADQLLQAKMEVLSEAIHVVETYEVSVGNSASGELAAEWTMQNLREIRDKLVMDLDELEKQSSDSSS
jgi:hypothetical protein